MRAIVRHLILAAVALGIALSSSRAQAPDPLAEASGDPMALSRAVRSLGDDEVLGRLGAETHAARGLAITAAPFLDAPERALAILAEIAGGDDPDEAPAASRAAWTIASGLSVLDLDRREWEVEPTLASAEAYQRLSDDASARADIRLLAASTAEVVLALVPAPE